VLAGGGDVAAHGAERFRAGQGSPAAGDLLLQFDHPQVAFGLVVVERHGEVDGEPQHVIAVSRQAARERRGGVVGQPGGGVGGLREVPGVASGDRRGDVVGESVTAGGLGGGDLPVGVAQHLGEMLGPLATGVGGGRQLAQGMGVAQPVSDIAVAAVGRPPVVDRHPGEGGQTPAASVAALPRRVCTVSSVCRAVAATCTQCNRPATLAPVSSTCTTAAAIRCRRITSTDGATASAAWAVTAATVPVDTGAPRMSVSSRAVRSTGRC